MRKIEKGYNVKIISVIVASLLLCNAIVYSYPASRDSLRVPFLTKKTEQKRKIQFPVRDRELVEKVQRFLNMSFGDEASLKKDKGQRQRIIDSYPPQEKLSITSLIENSKVGGRAKNHGFRLLEYNRTKVERQFGKALFKFYDTEMLSEKKESKYPGTYRVIQSQNNSTILFWTIAPYLYDELLKLGLDESFSFEVVCAWVDQRAYDDYFKDKKKFFFGNKPYLIGLGSYASPFILRDEKSHEFARILARYVLTNEEYQVIILRLLKDSIKGVTLQKLTDFNL